VLQSVLENFQQFEPQVVKDTLDILAMLIDWTELHYFQAIIQEFCMQILQNPQ
jgi:hypothetical protein